MIKYSKNLGETFIKLNIGEIISMNEFIELDGYHGTFAQDVEDIRRNGFTYESREDHWLGQGIYFYDKSDMANWFISRKIKNKSAISKIAVIKVFLKTTSEKVLDLDTIEGVNIFYEKLDQLWNEFKTVEFSADDERKNRCLILDVLKEVMNLDIIIYTFTPENPTYGRAQAAWFHDNVFPIGIKYKETQICATDNNCIKIENVEYYDEEYKCPSRIWFKYYKRK